MGEQEFDDALATLFERVVTLPGSTDVGTRLALASGTPVEEPLQGFALKIDTHAHRITDDDFRHVQAQGHSDDAVFEYVVAASLGAGVSRWRDALQALGEET